jgi:hypothetical protein
MKSMIVTAALAAAAGLMGASAADATLLNFSLTGDYTASWQLDSDAIPDQGLDGVGNQFNDVYGTYPGSTVDYVADIAFFPTVYGGGLGLYDFYFDPGATDEKIIVQLDGDQLYTGTETAPHFKTGTFTLTNSDPDSLPGSYTLTISAAAVPEPSSWALAIVGIGAVGGMMRARTRKVSFAAA